MTGKVKTNAYQKFIRKVEAGQLAGRLHNYAMAKKSDEDYENKFMTNAQVAAANILLKKVVPDMKQVEHTGDVIVRVNKVERTIVDPEATDS